ncbi:MAG: LamG-like jellyroll fold domain-containing protein [Planctomycetota bacterium]
MDKKLTVPTLFLLLAILGNSAIGDLSTGLVAHWAFEGNFNDSAGANHAAPHGDARIVTDIEHGRVAEFDGTGDYLQIPNSPSLNITGDQITLASWVYFDDVSGPPEIVIAKAFRDGQHTSPYFSYGLHMLSNGTPRFWLSLSVGSRNAPGSPNFESGRWYHMAGVYDGSQMILYVDGEVSATNTNASGNLNGYDTPLFLGINGGRGEPMGGRIDDVAIYSRALTQQEIQQVMQGLSSPALASDPNPEDGAADVPRDVALSWTPGEFAPAINGHRVYFSESFGDVNDGVGGTTISASSYAPPQRLDFETSYYWRVDEVNAPPDSTVFRGDIWTFTTEPVGYPIDGANIKATASSVGQADVGPEKSIDGSGLDPDGLHSTEPTDMWLSGSEPLGAWIQYEFDKVRKLHEMWVWNSNQIFEGLFGFGMKEVTVEYSSDGITWTALTGVPEFARAPGTAGYAHDTTVDFGGAATNQVRLTATSNWGGVLPQYGLSEVRFFSIPVSAREPSPNDGAVHVNPAMTLSWRAGREAATHNVYLIADQQAVIDGTVPAVTVTDARYSSALDLGSTYYWRVDEVNEAATPTTWTGAVWSFSTSEYLVADGFESYNDIDPPDPDSHRIFESWSDGYGVATNGALIGHDPPQPSYTETTIVHDGDQSLPLFYNNTGGAGYSETTRTFAPGQDWTKHGVKTLVLWFHGDPDNAGGQLYVKVNGIKVPFTGDAGALSKPWWTQWNIDLASTGANLQNVTEFGVGIDGAGAAGTLYIDDIVLYRLAPEAVTAQDPGNENLVAHYAMESNGTDSSGNGNNGTPIGFPAYAPGIAGMAMDFDGMDDRLDLGTLDVIGPGITLSMWVNPKSYMFNDTRIISKATSTASNDHWWMVSTSGANHVLRFRLKTNDGQNTTTLIADSGGVLEGEWTHAAATWDGSTMHLYRNLELVGSAAKGGTAVAVDATVAAAIGNQPADAGDKHWVGLIDEVKIYSRGLSMGELLSVASGP